MPSAGLEGPIIASVGVAIQSKKRLVPARRLCARMGKPRANTAVAHKLARRVYFMLTRGEAYVDQGHQQYEEQQRQRSIAALRRRAADLGFAITPVGATV